jgi:glycosyltransferase involved in cell wall biosynthesis
MAEMTPHARLTNQIDAMSSAIARDRAVTVLMPTLNGAAFVLEQLQSLATQTLLPTRLVVSDDGSRDATLAKIAGFAHLAPFPITILRGPRQGVAANVLSLLASAPPGAVALCDQDDVWLPEKLARARAALAGLPLKTPALYAGARVVTDRFLSTRHPSVHYPLFPEFAAALVQNPAAGNTILLNGAGASLARMAARDLTNAPPFHDWWLCQLVLGAGGTVLLDPVPQVLYRQHNANALGANTGLRRRLGRLRTLFNGSYGQWITLHAEALYASRARLTPTAEARLLDLRAALATGGHHIFDGPLQRAHLFESFAARCAARLGRLAPKG